MNSCSVPYHHQAYQPREPPKEHHLSNSHIIDAGSQSGLQEPQIIRQQQSCDFLRNEAQYQNDQKFDQQVGQSQGNRDDVPQVFDGAQDQEQFMMNDEARLQQMRGFSNFSSLQPNSLHVQDEFGSQAGIQAQILDQNTLQKQKKQIVHHQSNSLSSKIDLKYQRYRQERVKNPHSKSVSGHHTARSREKDQTSCILNRNIRHHDRQNHSREKGSYDLHNQFNRITKPTSKSNHKRKQSTRYERSNHYDFRELVQQSEENDLFNFQDDALQDCFRDNGQQQRGTDQLHHAVVQKNTHIQEQKIPEQPPESQKHTDSNMQNDSEQSEEKNLNMQFQILKEKMQLNQQHDQHHEKAIDEIKHSLQVNQRMLNQLKERKLEIIQATNRTGHRRQSQYGYDPSNLPQEYNQNQPVAEGAVVATQETMSLETYHQKRNQGLQKQKTSDNDQFEAQKSKVDEAAIPSGQNINCRGLFLVKDAILNLPSSPETPQACPEAPVPHQQIALNDQVLEQSYHQVDHQNYYSNWSQQLQPNLEQEMHLQRADGYQHVFGLDQGESSQHQQPNENFDLETLLQIPSVNQQNRQVPLQFQNYQPPLTSREEVAATPRQQIEDNEFDNQLLSWHQQEKTNFSRRRSFLNFKQMKQKQYLAKSKQERSSHQNANPAKRIKKTKSKSGQFKVQSNQQKQLDQPAYSSLENFKNQQQKENQNFNIQIDEQSQAPIFITNQQQSLGNVTEKRSAAFKSIESQCETSKSKSNFKQLNRQNQSIAKQTFEAKSSIKSDNSLNRKHNSQQSERSQERANLNCFRTQNPSRKSSKTPLLTQRERKINDNIMAQELTTLENKHERNPSKSSKSRSRKKKRNLQKSKSQSYLTKQQRTIEHSSNPGVQASNRLHSMAKLLNERKVVKQTQRELEKLLEIEIILEEAKKKQESIKRQNIRKSDLSKMHRQRCKSYYEKTRCVDTHRSRTRQQSQNYPDELKFEYQQRSKTPRIYRSQSREARIANYRQEEGSICVEDRLIEQGKLYQHRLAEMQNEKINNQKQQMQDLPQINQKSVSILLGDHNCKQIKGAQYLSTNVEDRLIQLGEASQLKKQQMIQEAQSREKNEWQLSTKPAENEFNQQATFQGQAQSQQTSQHVQKMSQQRLQDFIENQNKFMVRKENKMTEVGQQSKKECLFQPQINMLSRKMVQKHKGRSKSATCLKNSQTSANYLLNESFQIKAGKLDKKVKENAMTKKQINKVENQSQSKELVANQRESGSQQKMSLLLQQLTLERQRDEKKSLEKLRGIITAREQRSNRSIDLDMPKQFDFHQHHANDQDTVTKESNQINEQSDQKHHDSLKQVESEVNMNKDNRAYLVQQTLQDEIDHLPTNQDTLNDEPGANNLRGPQKSVSTLEPSKRQTTSGSQKKRAPSKKLDLKAFISQPKQPPSNLKSHCQSSRNFDTGNQDKVSQQKSKKLFHKLTQREEVPNPSMPKDQKPTSCKSRSTTPTKNRQATLTKIDSETSKRFFEKNINWQKRIQQKRQQIHKQLIQKECYPFQPDIKPKEVRKKIDKNMYHPNYNHLNVQSIQKFIIRQYAARQQKVKKTEEEKQRAGSGNLWNGKNTNPKTPKVLRRYLSQNISARNDNNNNDIIQHIDNKQPKQPKHVQTYAEIHRRSNQDCGQQSNQIQIKQHHAMSKSVSSCNIVPTSSYQSAHCGMFTERSLNQMNLLSKIEDQNIDFSSQSLLPLTSQITPRVQNQSDELQAMQQEQKNFMANMVDPQFDQNKYDEFNEVGIANQEHQQNFTIAQVGLKFSKVKPDQMMNDQQQNYSEFRSSQNLSHQQEHVETQDDAMSGTVPLGSGFDEFGDKKRYDDLNLCQKFETGCNVRNIIEPHQPARPNNDNNDQLFSTEDLGFNPTAANKEIKETVLPGQNLGEQPPILMITPTISQINQVNSDAENHSSSLNTKESMAKFDQEHNNLSQKASQLLGQNGLQLKTKVKSTLDQPDHFQEMPQKLGHHNRYQSQFKPTYQIHRAPNHNNSNSKRYRNVVQKPMNFETNTLLDIQKQHMSNCPRPTNFDQVAPLSSIDNFSSIEHLRQSNNYNIDTTRSQIISQSLSQNQNESYFQRSNNQQSRYFCNYNEQNPCHNNEQNPAIQTLSSERGYEYATDGQGNYGLTNKQGQGYKPVSKFAQLYAKYHSQNDSKSYINLQYPHCD